MSHDADGPAPLPTTERMVYEVPSDNPKRKPYRVDCLANGGAMRCSCADFQARRQPALDAGGEPHTAATLCKHCRKVIRYFTRELFKQMAEELEHDTDTTDGHADR